MPSTRNCIDLEKAFGRRVPRWYFGRLKWKDKEFGSTRATPRSYLGVSTTPIFCGGCSRRVQRRCSGISGPLKAYSSLRVRRWTGQTRWVDSKPMTEATLGNKKLEAWGGAIFLLPRRLLIPRWQLSSRFHHRIPCPMGQIPWAPGRELRYIFTVNTHPIVWIYLANLTHRSYKLWLIFQWIMNNTGSYSHIYHIL